MSPHKTRRPDIGPLPRCLWLGVMSLLGLNQADSGVGYEHLLGHHHTFILHSNFLQEAKRDPLPLAFVSFAWRELGLTQVYSLFGYQTTERIIERLTVLMKFKNPRPVRLMILENLKDRASREKGTRCPWLGVMSLKPVRKRKKTGRFPQYLRVFF